MSPEAASTGRRFENTIKCVLRDRGYLIKRHHRICTGIYGTTLWADFFVSNIAGYQNGLVIECKWQDVHGTADEKFPYLIQNIKKKFPCPAIIVIAGSGYRPGAIEWLRNQVDGKTLLGVLSYEEFLSWVNRDMPGAAETLAIGKAKEQQATLGVPI